MSCTFEVSAERAPRIARRANYHETSQFLFKKAPGDGLRNRVALRRTKPGRSRPVVVTEGSRSKRRDVRKWSGRILMRCDICVRVS
jgi:hypothetical protein